MSKTKFCIIVIWVEIIKMGEMTWYPAVEASRGAEDSSEIIDRNTATLKLIYVYI